jgi:hypothetical protein
MNRDTKGRFTRKPTVIEAEVGMDNERYAAFEALFEDLGMKYPMAGFIVHWLSAPQASSWATTSLRPWR